MPSALSCTAGRQAGRGQGQAGWAQRAAEQRRGSAQQAAGGGPRSRPAQQAKRFPGLRLQRRIGRHDAGAEHTALP